MRYLSLIKTMDRLFTHIIIFHILFYLGLCGATLADPQTSDPILLAQQEVEQKLKKAEQEQNIVGQLGEIIALIFEKPNRTQTPVGGSRVDGIPKELLEESSQIKEKLKNILTQPEIMLLQSNFFIKHGYYDYALIFLKEAQKLAPNDLLINQTIKEVKEVKALPGVDQVAK